MRQKKLAIGLRLSAARGSIGNAVRQSLGNLRATEDDISNVSGVGVIDHFGAGKPALGHEYAFSAGPTNVCSQVVF